MMAGPAAIMKIAGLATGLGDATLISAGRARLFAQTSERGSMMFPAGEGVTNKFGDVVYSTLGSADDVALARYHESVHSFLSPKLILFRDIRASIGEGAYVNSSLVRYLEEALAETYAQVRVNGIGGITTGIAFPITQQYVTLGGVLREVVIGTTVVGGTTYVVVAIARD